MAEKKRVLFLCTGNSCRSQMSEAFLKNIEQDKFEAHSAGSQPAGFLHPITTDILEYMGIPYDGQESKSWEVYRDAPLDLVVMLCDNAAQEECPGWGGHPIQVHWSTPDPAYHTGSSEERFQFALTVANRLREKVFALTQIDLSGDREQVASALQRLGEI